MKPLSRKTNIVVQDLENETLIYDLSYHKAFCLNQTSALIYQLSDGTNSISEISSLMSKKLKVIVSEDVVWFALEELKKFDLLENSSELSNNFAGMNRRQVIRKVGFASLVALPVIASIVAPVSADAASLNCSCASPGQCAAKTGCPNTNNCNGANMCAP